MSRRWFEYSKLPTSDGHLPLNSNSNHSFLGLRLLVPKRYSRLLLGLLIALLFTVTVLLPRRRYNNSYTHPSSYPQVLHTPPNDTTLPPLYEAYIEYENNLPQQQDDDNFAEHKYIYMANHVFGLGWNNVLQDMIYNSLVASESGRG